MGKRTKGIEQEMRKYDNEFKTDKKVIDKEEIIRNFIHGLLHGEIKVDLTLRDGTRNRNTFYDNLEQFILDYLDEDKPEQEKKTIAKNLFKLITTMRVVDRITTKTETSSQEIQSINERIGNMDARLNSTNKLLDEITKMFPKGNDPEP
ncbi:MAG: hypothetical protein ACREBI_08525 [Nitrosotalea sp.]